MPRTLSANIQTLIAQPRSSVCHLLTFTAGATVYTFAEDQVIFQGRTYLPHLVMDSAIKYTQTLQLSPVTVKLQNITLEMAAVLKSQQSDLQGVTATLQRFFLEANDYVTLFVGVITQLDIDEQNVLLTLANDIDPTASRVPARNYSQLCVWNFKDANCGYADGVDPNDPTTGQPYVICSKDFLSCTARGRTQRFPGFIYLVSDLTQAIEGQQPNTVLSNPLSSILTTPWETP